jgi:hypothetical protein
VPLLPRLIATILVEIGSGKHVKQQSYNAVT